MSGRFKGVLRYFVLVLGIGVASALYVFRTHMQPLGEPRRIGFPEVELSAPDQLRFLDGDFRILKKLHELPGPVLDALREENGSRLTMVDPGRRFEAADSIIDPSLPNRRLIFAGIIGDRVFVHYEEGGITHSFILALLRLSTEGKVEGLSRDYCGPAADLQTLRREIEHGNCKEPVPREMR